jgi:hypothetical protein
MLIGALESNLSAMEAQGGVADDEVAEEPTMSFDEGGGRHSSSRIRRPVVKHLSPERAEAVAQEGLRRSGYGART